MHRRPRRALDFTEQEGPSRLAAPPCHEMQPRAQVHTTPWCGPLRRRLRDIGTLASPHTLATAASRRVASPETASVPDAPRRPTNGPPVAVPRGAETDDRTARGEHEGQVGAVVEDWKSA